MSYYPRVYPVLDKNEWKLDVKKDFDKGAFEGTAYARGGLRLSPGKAEGTYVTELIDLGQAVAWKEISWETDLPEGAHVSIRTCHAETPEECGQNRWSSRYTSSPSNISLVGSREGTINVAAVRCLKLRIELKAGKGGSPVLKSIKLKCGVVPPACVGPMNLSTVEPGSPHFYWTPVEGSASYGIELASDAGFNNIIFKLDGITEPGLIYPKKLNGGTYHWRLWSVDGTGQPSERSRARQFNVGTLPEVDLSHLQHPYLYFKKEDIPAIREKLFGKHKATWDIILERADTAFNYRNWNEYDTLESADNAWGMINLCNEVAHNQILHCSFVWLMTGEEKYGAKARELILRLLEMGIWCGPKFMNPKEFYPVWLATLENAMLSRHVAVSYDMLYDYLDEDDRRVIREGLLRLGVLPCLQSWAEPSTIRYIPRHQMSAGNWWSVCNGGGGVAALALITEIPEAQKWVKMFADAQRDFLTYPGGDIFNIDLKAGHGGQNVLKTDPNWGEDGGYIESIGYSHYALLFSTYFMEALKNTTGEDLGSYVNPKLLDQPLYFGYWGKNGWETLNFNDARPENWSDVCYSILVRRQRSGLAKYMLETTCPTYKNITALVTEDNSVQATPPDPKHRNKLFKDIGWSIFRSGWDKEATLMAAKFTQGRGHNDLGQYIIHYKGQQFIVDSGITIYTDTHYHSYSRTTQGHNTLMIDDKPQIRADGKVLGFAEVPGAGIVEADLTPAYPDLVNSWKRTLVYLEPGCFVVIDRLTSDEEHKYDWILHPLGEQEIIPGVGGKFTQEESTLHLHLISPNKWNASSYDGYVIGTAAKYHMFTPEKPCKDATFVAVFTGAGRGQEVKVDKEVEVDRIAVRITTPDATYTVMTHADNGHEMGAWDVSANAATCAVVRTKDGAIRWALSGRGPLRIGDKVIAGDVKGASYRAGE